MTWTNWSVCTGAGEQVVAAELQVTAVDGAFEQAQDWLLVVTIPEISLASLAAANWISVVFDAVVEFFEA